MPSEGSAVPRGQLLWQPSAERIESSNLLDFMKFAEARRGQAFRTYEALYDWSVEDVGAFWESVAEFCGWVRSGSYSAALSTSSMPGVRWFEGVHLSYTENLLYPSHGVEDPGKPAIIFESESAARRRVLSFAELREQVARCARGLRALGVKPGDRVAALTPNVPEAVVAMLAATAVGAIWSSCSPDFGVQGILDRFGQIEPVVLFGADGYEYNGKRHGLGARLRAVCEAIPTIRNVIVYSLAGPSVDGIPHGQSWDEFLDGPSSEWTFEHFPFAQPLYILYTSGTTGKPKCLIHGAGGVLLKHLEEHRLQSDLKPDDVVFYFTTCGWMMWNWLVSALASGSTIVLYDGSPLHPDPGRLFRMVDRSGVTKFGTSPRFLATVEKAGYVPRKHHSLATLRTIFSTGSPLHAEQFGWIYDAVKSDLQVASISGGTDLVGCFVLGSPLAPVHAGEIQCRALGMKVESLDDNGRAVVGEKGELTCSTPFPSMPLGLWNDPDGSKYRAAYFERFPGKWHHGDFIEITERGSVVIYGRSDATLNPGGVRIGTAEIYHVVEGMQEITDAIAVGLEEDGDVKILLFVVLVSGRSLDGELVDSIRTRIREATSPRHVPAEVHQISEVPRTISGKPVEMAVARVLRGEDPGNRDALANPESLEQFTPR